MSLFLCCRVYLVGLVSNVGQAPSSYGGAYTHCPRAWAWLLHVPCPLIYLLYKRGCEMRCPLLHPLRRGEEVGGVPRN